MQFEEEEKEKGWCRMKKLLASLLVLAMCAPAMALTFSTSATDNVLTINYNLAAGEGLRGLALTITQVGAGDAAVTDVDAGPFNTFMDYAYSAGDTYTIDPANQHPVALIGGPGVATLPAAALGGFSLSMGYLDENGVEPKGEAITTSGSIVVTFEGTAATEVAIALDTLRGGAVGDELATIDDSGLVNQIIGFDPVEAISNTAPFYGDWVTLGRPACWAFERNCNGDANGKAIVHPVLGTTYVTTDDLNILIAGWNVKEAPKGIGVVAAGGVCADFNRTAIVHPVLGTTRVTTDDLNKLIAGWNVKEAPKGPGVPKCPLVSEGGYINYYEYPQN